MTFISRTPTRKGKFDRMRRQNNIALVNYISFRPKPHYPCAVSVSTQPPARLRWAGEREFIMISTKNIGKIELFNAKSACVALQTVSDTLTVTGAAIVDETNAESGEISEVGYIFDKDGNVYGTISATVIDMLPALIDFLDEVDELPMNVVHRQAKSGREFISLQIVK